MCVAITRDIHESSDVGAHVIQGVWGIHREPELILQKLPPQHGLSPLIKARGGTGIAVIEQENFIAAIGQSGYQSVAPRHIGTTQAHDDHGFGLIGSGCHDSVGDIELSHLCHL